MDMDESFKEDFLLGTVIPDGIADKDISHFHGEEQAELITKYHDFPKIMIKYRNKISTPYDLGILAHLYLDYIYVTEFWQKYFDFYDEQGNIEYHTEKISYVHIFNTDKRIPLTDFFSEKYFYGDYDRTNAYLKGLFQSRIPDVSGINRAAIHISECRDCDTTILEKYLTDLKGLAPAYGSPETAVFPYDALVHFIMASSRDFIKQISMI